MGFYNPDVFSLRPQTGIHSTKCFHSDQAAGQTEHRSVFHGVIQLILYEIRDLKDNFLGNISRQISFLITNHPSIRISLNLGSYLDYYCCVTIREDGANVFVPWVSGQFCGHFIYPYNIIIL